jgi:D-glycero-alpha-D-manno-heptose-7-phosphate kinase
MILRAKAPLRISFAGGGTDVPPYPAQEGGLVLNATINKFAWGSLRTSKDDQITVDSADMGISLSYRVGTALAFDGRLDLVKAGLRRFCDGTEQGFNIFLQSDAPPGSGLGSSSALMVALTGLMKEFRNLPLTDYETAHLAYEIERKDLGIPGGLQDQYAATFGGFNFTEFSADRVIVNPLRIRQGIVNELEHNLLLCFTGTTRRADHIIDDQSTRFREHVAPAVEGLRRQKEIAVEMKNALLQGRLSEFGQLLDEAWQAKKNLSSRISNSHIDDLYDAAKAAGAVGGKITGAGGGGYMLFYCQFEKKHRVAEALRALGAQPTDFAFEPNGMQTWRVNEPAA